MTIKPWFFLGQESKKKGRQIAQKFKPLNLISELKFLSTTVITLQRDLRAFPHDLFKKIKIN